MATTYRHLKEMDILLDLYYKQNGISDYFTANNRKGRFSNFCIGHKLSSCTRAVFKNEDLIADVDECPFLSFDPFFPYSDVEMTEYEKKREVQWIIQHCFVYKQPPFLQRPKYLNCTTIKPFSSKKDKSSPKKRKSMNKAIDLDLCIAQLTGVEHWYCAKCTFKNVWSMPICIQCGYKRSKRFKNSTNDDEEQSENTINEHFVRLLVYGFGRELSEETGYEIPTEIEKMLLSYFYLCSCWDDVKIAGFFRVSGFMKDCLERTKKGKGAWQNMYSEQCIVAKGHFAWKLRVKELEFFPNAHEIGGGDMPHNHSIIVGVYGIKNNEDTPENSHKPFAYYDDGYGKYVDCHSVDQVIEIDLDFDYNHNETVGLMTINKVQKCLIPKLSLDNDKQIMCKNYKFAIAMSVHGLKIEFFHFGYW